jgi:hypothetical protein
VSFNFGKRRKIFDVHFRNVSAPLPHFVETFPDDGYLDMSRSLISFCIIDLGLSPAAAVHGFIGLPDRLPFRALLAPCPSPGVAGTVNLQVQ